jgi:hypothetical protein
VFEPNDSGLSFIKQHHIQRLYLRLFDVTVNTACYKKRYDTLSAEALASPPSLTFVPSGDIFRMKKSLHKDIYICRFFVTLQ